MTKPKKFLILLWSVFWEAFFVCSLHAANFYVDPQNGDNKNSGRSPQTAWHSPQKTTPQDKIVFIGPKNCQLALKENDSSRKPALIEQNLKTLISEKYEQIILGEQSLEDWVPYLQATTVYQAPLTLDFNTQSIESVRIDEKILSEACYSDFLYIDSWAWESNFFFLHSSEGNPDLIGSQVVVTLFDSDNLAENTISGWSQAPVYVWQTDLAQMPVHLFRNGEIFENWWWGEDECGSLPDIVYVRSLPGEPVNDASSMSAAMEEGGWGIASGDFNGDGLVDIVTSDFGPHILVYYGARDFSTTSNTILSGPEDEDVLGFYVALAGDVNRDGYEDLLVGMDWRVNRVYLYFGSEQGLSNESYQMISPPDGRPGFGFGHALSGNVDINADGFADLLIAGGGSYVGVYLGSNNGVESQPDQILTFSGSVEGEIINVAGLGDTNGDGFDDIVISNSQTNVTSLSAHVFFGSDQGVSEPAHSLVFDTSTDDVTKGLTVGAIGDINADGYDDVLIADPYANLEFERQGIVHLFLGSAQGLNGTPDLTIPNPEPEENVRFGAAISGLGDFNHDGFNDLAVGSPYANKIFFFFGSSMGPQIDDYTSIENNYDFGWSIIPVGNIKGSDQNYIAVGEEFGICYLYALKKGQTLPADENQAPTARAGADQTVLEGSTVYLDGSESEDVDDGISILQWTQIEGPKVVLSDNLISKPSFVTPPVPFEGATLRFNFSVLDHFAEQSNDEVLININDNGITGFSDNAVTLTTSNGKQMGFIVEQGGTLVALNTENPETFMNQPDLENIFLYDLISLKIKTIETGGETILTWYLSDPVEQNTKLIQYNPETGWRDISNQSSISSDGTQLRMTQVDGNIGDEDMQPNKMITLNHLAMSTKDELPHDPSNPDNLRTKSSSGGGCFIDVVSFEDTSSISKD